MIYFMDVLNLPCTGYNAYDLLVSYQVAMEVSQSCIYSWFSSLLAHACNAFQNVIAL